MSLEEYVHPTAVYSLQVKSVTWEHPSLSELREESLMMDRGLIIIWYLLHQPPLHRSISYLKPTTTVFKTGVVNVPSVLTTAQGKFGTIWLN